MLKLQPEELKQAVNQIKNTQYRVFCLFKETIKDIKNKLTITTKINQCNQAKQGDCA